MKNTLLSLLVLLCMSMQVQAQTWAPLGMTWKYLVINDVWNPKDQLVTTLKATDTFTIDGHLCTLIRDMKAAYADTTRLTVGSGFITYEDAGIVYLRSPVTKKFTVLYDFNKKSRRRMVYIRGALKQLAHGHHCLSDQCSGRFCQNH